MEMRAWPKLHLRAKADPKGKKAAFCVFFGNHGVEHFEFDGDKDHNLESTNSDNDCKP